MGEIEENGFAELDGHVSTRAAQRTESQPKLRLHLAAQPIIVEQPDNRRLDELFNFMQMNRNQNSKHWHSNSKLIYRLDVIGYLKKARIFKIFLL